MPPGAVALVALLLSTPVPAQEIADDPSNLFGSRGLMGTPSARMAPDGELSVGASFLRNNQHYNFEFQALPWLDTTFRYSGLQHFNPDYPVYYDRAFGVKVRLWDEGDVVPAVAVGIDDIIGTGVYSGEYVVASKRFGDVDTSLGMGWGRYGGDAAFKNPLSLVFPSFGNRSGSYNQAGAGNFSQFFHGPKVGIFGGAVWHTPLDGLALLVEYDSDNYAQEKAQGNLSPRSQVNYGMTYAVSDATQVGLDWLYGTSLGGSVSLRLDPVHPQYPQKIDSPAPPVTVRSDEQRLEALATLEDLRDPGIAERARLRQSRDSDRNGFVDALWRQGGDYSDIELRQNLLDLTVTGTISSTRCAATARLMQGKAVHIDRVRLRDPDGRRSVSCVVPRTIEGAPFSAAFLAVPDAEMLATPAVAVQTIDASGVAVAPDRAHAERAIRAAIEAQHLLVLALSLGQGELLLYYENDHYFAETDAIDRIARVLSKEAPPRIEKFRLVAVEGGMPVREFDILRGPMERSYEQEDGTIFNHSVHIMPPAMNQPVLAEAQRERYPLFSWALYPQFRQALFDPSQPFGVQFLAVAAAGLHLAPGLALFGSVEGNLYDNFNTARVSDSVLPHVRSDFMKYFTKGKNGLGNLEADYSFRLAPDVFAKARGGYLESMFAGAGGEILWRPEGARWALGADIYQVWQRDFDRLFGLQHYHQTTGHVSLYYDSPWYGLNFELRAGQYLAGDRGLTIQITRRFATGVEIGAFMTKTNVSASRFGEGSFDKGLIIRFPLGWVAPLETQSQIGLDLRPVQRDGGQVLAGDATLYEETRNSSEGELLRQQPGLWIRASLTRAIKSVINRQILTAEQSKMAISNEVEAPFEPPSAVIADYLRKSISVSYLLGLAWSGRLLIAFATVAGLLYGVYTIYDGGPSYMATMRVSPASSDTSLGNTSAASGLLAGLTGESGAAQLPKFIQFTYAMSSLEVARALDQKYDLLCQIYRGQCDPLTHQWKSRHDSIQNWIVSATSRLSGLPDPNVGPRPPLDLAKFIATHVVAEQLKKTDSVITLSFIDRKPEFAAQFLSQVVKATNDYVRTQNRETQKRYVEYLSGSAAQTTNVEQRQAIDTLLLNEERQLMMTEVDVPYAAQILDGPTVTPENHALKTIAIYTAIGLALGVAAAMSRDLYPRRRWRLW